MNPGKFSCFRCDQIEAENQRLREALTEARVYVEEARDEAKSDDSFGNWDNEYAVPHDNLLNKIDVLIGCQCTECETVPHKSDCAVHSEPAIPKRPCNCGAKAREAQSK